LSMNLEIPTESGLKLLAPDKNHQDMINPMRFVKNELIQYKEEKKKFKSTPKFAPAGQSTQVIVGATKENDFQIIQVADHFYNNFNLKRVYYSGYVPVSNDARLPAIGAQVPLVRENRLYQADWLMRFYGFKANEILEKNNPFLDLEVDPKMGWALRNITQFPVIIQNAPLEMILRVPGIGVKSAHKIVYARRFQNLTMEHLKKIGVSVNRAKYFISVSNENTHLKFLNALNLKEIILGDMKSKFEKPFDNQLSLLNDATFLR
jgi:putative DNA modification/repair radical SAM protein